MRKPGFCICENKGADQLCSNCTADQHLCFRYSDSTIPLLLKAIISNLYPASVTVQAGLCRAWLDPPKTSFLALRLIVKLSVCLFLAYIQEAGPSSQMPTDPEQVPVDVKELAKEKLEINYLLENVFLITVDEGKKINLMHWSLIAISLHPPPPLQPRE